MQAGFKFVVLDAGGGTLDVSSYTVTDSSPVELRELTTPDCEYSYLRDVEWHRH